MINNRVDPFNILSLTFTNKTAREMKKRIVEKKVGHDAQNLWMGTFSTCVCSYFKIEAEKLGSCNFTIYDSDDSKVWLKIQWARILMTKPP